MYAREKSDRVVVTVNPPNKADPYSGEGRPRTEENIVRIPHEPDSERALRDAGVVRCAVRRVYRYSSEVGAVCGSSARTDLTEPRDGNDPGRPSAVLDSGSSSPLGEARWGELWWVL